MRVKAIGVMRMTGISKSTGAPYDFAQVLYLNRINPVSSEKFKVQGLGYEVGKLDLDVTCLHKFNDVPFPCDLDLATEQYPGRNGIKTVVVGFLGQEQGKTTPPAGNVKAVA